MQKYMFIGIGNVSLAIVNRIKHDIVLYSLSKTVLMIYIFVLSHITTYSATLNKGGNMNIFHILRSTSTVKFKQVQFMDISIVVPD